MNRIDSKHWSIIIFLMLVSVGITLALFVHRTTTDISDALAAEVLQQHSDVARLQYDYDALLLALERERLSGSDNVSADIVESALHKIETQLEVMRFSYSFERLDGAAQAHAYIKPVLEDVRQWIGGGLPGIKNDRQQLIAFASRRIADRQQSLRDIAHETDIVASELVNAQTSYLTRFGQSLMYLLTAFLLLALGIAALLTRQRDLQFQIAEDQRQNTQRIKDFADTAADWFWEMNHGLRLRFLSGQSLSRPAANVSQSGLEDRRENWLPAFDHEIVDEHWPLQALNSQSEFSEFESEWVARDGSVKTIAVSGKPLYDNKGYFEGYRGIGRDITTRKKMELDLELANRALIEAETRGRHQAEQALRDSEMFLRTSINALPENLAILDTNGLILEVNTAWRKFAATDINGGGNADNIADGLGRHYSEIIFTKFFADDHVLRDIAAKINHVLNGYSESLQTEFQITHSDQINWFAVDLSPFESNGKWFGVLAIDEVTGRKNLEEQDRQLRAELAHFSRLTTVGELATGLAHELNQPLTAISHNCDALISGFDSDRAYDADDLEAIRAIQSESDRAGAIIKGLRKMVRKETGAVLPTDINQLVTDTMRLSMPDANKHGIRVKLNLADDLPQPEIDAVQIQQVLVNLERNGVDAIRAGESKLREMVISTNYDKNGFICVTVRDSGGGLSVEGRENLFQPFQTTKKNGMGMGLSISRSIVESHGGQLWVDFDDPVMTTFNFTLPVGDAGTNPANSSAGTG